MAERECPIDDAWTDLGTLMSNFDHSVEAGFAEALAAPKTFGEYAGWNFHAEVWKEGEEFCAIVWVYHQVRGIRSAPSLPQLMEVVSNEFGWD